MALQTAITADQFKMLRGTATIKPRAVVAPYVSKLPGTILLAARVNGTPTGDAFSQISYDTVTSGSHTNLKVGHRVIISHSSSIQDRFFDGRVTWRLATSSILYINRTSEPITNDDWIWVIEDFPILERPLFVNADGSFNYDYDEAFSGLPPIIGGVQGVYAGFIDRISSKFRVSFAATIYAGESGTSIASILYSTPDGTVISGSLSTANVTIDFPAGFRFVDLTATDSGGRAWTLHIAVWAEPRDGTSTTLLTGVTNINLQGDLSQGFSGSIDAFTDISALLPNHRLCIWDDESLSGAITLVGTTSSGSASVTLASTTRLIVGQRVSGTGIPGNTTVTAIPDATHITLSANATATGSPRLSFKSPSVGSNVRFVGRFRNESNRSQADPSYGPIRTTSLPLESEAQQLARIEGPRVTTEHSAAPAAPNEILNWAPWRAALLILAKYSTFLLTNALNIPDRSDTYLFEGRNTDGGGCLNTVNGLGQGVAQTLLQFAPWGAAEFARHGCYLDDETARAALPVIADLTAQDLLADSQIDVQYIPSVSLVDASGGTWNSSTNFVEAMRAFSPGPGRGTGDTPNALPRQILKANVSNLTAQTDLINRAGNERRKGIGKAVMTLRHPDGYGFFIPAINQWYRLTLTATDTNLRGIAFTTATRWIVDRVAYAWDTVAGTKDVQVTYLQETNGNGEGKIIEDPSADDNGLPALDDPFDLYLDDFPLDMPGEDSFGLNKGVKNLGGFNGDGNFYQTGDFTTPGGSGGPTWAQVSLGVSGTPVAAVGDPYSPRYLGAGSQVNGWVATTTGLYRVTDLQGTPSATLQKTFRGTTSRRSLQISFGTEYDIVCISNYSDGTYSTYSTDGTSWSTEVLRGDAAASTFMPGVAVSSRIAGRVVASRRSSGAGGGIVSTDSGATFSALTSPSIVTGSDLAGDIHVPYNNNSGDLIAFFGNNDWILDFDTTTLDQWVNNPDIHQGDFTLGTGWEDTCDVDGGGNAYRGVVIEFPFPLASLLTSVSVTYDAILGTQDSPLQFYIAYNNTSVPNRLVVVPSANGTDATLSWSGSQSGVTKVVVAIQVSYRATAGCAGTSGSSAIKRITFTGSGQRALVAALAATRTDVSPEFGYGPWQSRQIDSDSTNRAAMVVAAGNLDQSLAGIWVSSAGGAAGSWQELVTPVGPGSRYERCAISSDGNRVAYVWGSDGVIGISEDVATVDDRSGNLSSFAPGTFINIMGL